MPNMVYKRFSVADHDSEETFEEFGMADPIWRFTNHTFDFPVNQNSLH